MKPCPNCGSDDVYKHRKTIDIGTGYTTLIPHIGWLSQALVHPVVCGSCGMIGLIATEATINSVKESKHWVRA